jgi:hypothetical protein
VLAIALQQRGLPLHGAQQQPVRPGLLGDGPRLGQPRRLRIQLPAPGGHGRDSDQRTRLRYPIAAATGGGQRFLATLVRLLRQLHVQQLFRQRGENPRPPRIVIGHGVRCLLKPGHVRPVQLEAHRGSPFGDKEGAHRVGPDARLTERGVGQPHAAFRLAGQIPRRDGLIQHRNAAGARKRRRVRDHVPQLQHPLQHDQLLGVRQRPRGVGGSPPGRGQRPRGLARRIPMPRDLGRRPRARREPMIRF